ncbi:hypothetical protein [Subtercola boreus]|uniref:hypothetical protein n=1 Tax=Subtercola boreus TaxID=120213 RepID=UPI0011C021F8|nr:hypothetical protein [Subtercola boreus]
MPEKLVAALHPARLSSYESEWARLAGVSPTSVSRPAVAALYVWQVSLGSAWYETLAFTEAIVRNALDLSLRAWNIREGRSEDWLEDSSAPLAGLVAQSAKRSRQRATQAVLKRSAWHSRHGVIVSLDDRVAQLDFGSICFLLPQDAPARRATNGSGFTGRENLWLHATRSAFPLLSADFTRGWQGQLSPGVPVSVQNAYAAGHALERLRRLRNRIGHHEQTFRVDHARRLRDVTLLVRSISSGAADELEALDRVRRTLAMRPRP